MLSRGWREAAVVAHQQLGGAMLEGEQEGSLRGGWSDGERCEGIRCNAAMYDQVRQTVFVLTVHRRSDPMRVARPGLAWRRRYVPFSNIDARRACIRSSQHHMILSRASSLSGTASKRESAKALV